MRFCFKFLAFVAVLGMAGSSWAQSTAFQLDNRGTGGLFSHTPSDPFLDWTFIGDDVLEGGQDPGSDVLAMDADSLGDLYGVDFNTLNLGSIDNVTCDFTTIAPLSGDVPPTVWAMTIDENDLAWITDGVGLWTMDITTGVCTLVSASLNEGGINPITGVFELATDGAGNFWAFSISTDTLYELDESNGDLTIVAAYNGPGDPNFSNNGMDWDPVSGQLFGSVYTGGGTGSYGVWDITSGGGSTGWTEILNHSGYPAPATGAIGGPIACVGGTTFHINYWQDDYCTYDTPDPTSNFTSVDQPLGGAPPALFAMDFNESGVLYAVDNANQAWGTIDTTTGNYVQLGFLTGDYPAAGGTAVGITCDPVAGTFYLANTTSFFTLDVVTGNTVFVADFVDGDPGPSPVPTTVIDIACNSLGELYAFTIGDDNLYSVDKTTGDCLVVGPSPVDAGFAQGMDFDPTDDTLYASIYVSGGTGLYGTWDTTTGVFTTISPLEALPTPGDGYEFEIAIRDDGVPVTVNPTTITTTRGTYIEGDVAEISDSDNVDYRISRANNDIQARTEFVVKGFSPTQTPTLFEVTLEGSVFARSNVVQTIELFNYDTSSWEEVDSRNANRAPSPDSVVTVAATGDLARFVNDADGCIETRVRYRGDNPRLRFTSNSDQCIWTIQ